MGEYAYKIFDFRDQQPCNSLRQRQLGPIAAGVKRATKERENEAQRAKARIFAETRQHWISHLLETVEDPYHPRIERSREEYFAKKKEEEQKGFQVFMRLCRDLSRSLLLVMHSCYD